MKIKFVKTILLLGLIIALTPSCKKECITNAKCKENPQNDSTLCQAYFESWIYYADEKNQTVSDIIHSNENRKNE